MPPREGPRLLHRLQAIQEAHLKFGLEREVISKGLQGVFYIGIMSIQQMFCAWTKSIQMLHSILYEDQEYP